MVNRLALANFPTGVYLNLFPKHPKRVTVYYLKGDRSPEKSVGGNRLLDFKIKGLLITLNARTLENVTIICQRLNAKVSAELLIKNCACIPLLSL